MDSTLLWCVIVPIIAIVAILVMRNRSNAATAQSLGQARSDYEAALAVLKANPADPNRKQKALAAGRAYANLTRQRKGVTVFDEMMLMNDINAATAGAVAAAPAPTPAPAAPGATIEQRLAQLADLKARGIISEDEYAARRQKMLDEL